MACSTCGKWRLYDELALSIERLAAAAYIETGLHQYECPTARMTVEWLGVGLSVFEPSPVFLWDNPQYLRRMREPVANLRATIQFCHSNRRASDVMLRELLRKLAQPATR